MPARNSLDVEVWPLDGPTDPIEFNDVQYVSFVNFETFGIPAKIADTDVREEVRENGSVKIVYVNTQNVSVVEVTRTQ